MNTAAFSIATAALIVLAPPVAGAEMYRWVNEEGSTVYSNQPPADVSTVNEFTRIELPNGAEAKPEPPKIAVEPPKSEPELPTQRPSIRAQLPQAVQDPCLTSSDRYCYEKNKARYRPYVGYTPVESSVAEAQPVLPPARGASSGASGGGVVSGGTRK